MRRLAPIALLLGGCNASAESPAIIQTYGAAYDVLAACVYERINMDDPRGLRFVDLRAKATIIIGEYDDSVRMWEARFTAGDHGSARVEITVTPTIFGTNLRTSRIVTNINSCV